MLICGTINDMEEVTYTSEEIRDMPTHGAQVMTFREDMFETIDRDVHRQVSALQIEDYEEADRLYETIPIKEQTVIRQHPEWNQDEVQLEVSIIIDEIRSAVHGKLGQAIAALYALGAYRKEGVDEYLKNKNSTQSQNE